MSLTPQVFAGVQDNGLFELGNDTVTPAQGSADIQDSSTQAGPDWGQGPSNFGGLFDSTTAPITPNDANHTSVFLRDDVSAGSALDRTVYSGGPGDKNSDIVQDWTWGTSSVPVKDDIGNAYAYAVKDSNGHLIIYVGAERLSNSGDAHIDVEFFQKPVGLDRDPLVTPCPDGKCKFTGSNTNGDLLANMDFTNGGAFAGLTIRERDSSASNNYVVKATLNAQGCNTGTGSDTHPAGTVCAFTNGGTISNGGWDSYDSHGAPVKTIPANGFTEWGVDVTELFGQTDLCFSTIQVKTRSSQSFTATLKDFTVHSFQNCSGTVNTEIYDTATPPHKLADDKGFTSTVAAGTIVKDTAIVTGTVGAPTPTGSVTFERYPTADCTGTATEQANVPISETSPPTTTAAGIAKGTSIDFDTSGAINGVSYKAKYNGDSVYSATDLSSCEFIRVSLTNTSVNTDIRLGNINGDSVLNKKVNADTSIVDVATITVKNAGSTTPDPLGTVTFHRFTTANCSGPTSDETVTLAADSSTDGVSTAVSTAFKTVESQFYGYWVEFTASTTQGLYSNSVATVCEPICSFNDTPVFTPPAP